MIVSAEEAEQFYRVWWPLLQYVNDQRRIKPKLLGKPMTQGVLTPQQALAIRNALWKDDALREQFIADNPDDLSPADLDLIRSWQRRVAGKFFIFRHLKRYTVFISTDSPSRAYGVLGLLSPLEEVVPIPTPVLVEAVLLPFGDKIIYDGLIAPYNIMFGSGYRSDLNLAYRDAKEREGIITALPTDGAEGLDAQDVQARNTIILRAFRKDLFASGLSPATVDRHAGAIETFANAYLLARQPPRGLLDADTPDVADYLRGGGFSAKERGALITSFKRWVRFLEETARIDWDRSQELRELLKAYGRGAS